MSLDAMKQALEALEEAVFYTSSKSWSPSMTRECEAAITALRAAIEQAQDPETELETYKRLYELRGKALERPCSNCGHQPAKIKAMAQPEQEPVAWYDSKTGWTDFHAFKPVRQPSAPDAEWLPLYTTPPPRREWQGLTDADVKAPIQRAMQYFGFDSTHYNLGGAATIGFLGLVKEIEAKLKEKNT